MQFFLWCAYYLCLAAGGLFLLHVLVSQRGEGLLIALAILGAAIVFGGLADTRDRMMRIERELRSIAPQNRTDR